MTKPMTGTTQIAADWTPDGACAAYRHVCRGGWGSADVELIGSDQPAGPLDGFADVEDAALILTHPLVGWFLRPDRRLGQYAVWHERLRPQVGRARRARYGVFEDLGLVGLGDVPHSVLLQRSIEFDVLLPPHRA